MNIRRIGPSDLALFSQVADDVFDDPIDPQRLAQYLSRPEHLMVVAEHDGVIHGQAAGVIHYHPDKPTELYIDELGVAPSHLRQGIGRRMLEELLAWGIELQCEITWVGTEHDNIPARGLYAHFSSAQPFVMYEWELTRKD